MASDWDDSWVWDVLKLGSGMSSGRHADVCLVGVLCGSFVYEKPILGSGFEIFDCGTALVLGDFLRFGALGVMPSCVWTSVCTCSCKQVEAMVVELSIATESLSVISFLLSYCDKNYKLNLLQYSRSYSILYFDSL